MRNLLFSGLLAAASLSLLATDPPGAVAQDILRPETSESYIGRNRPKASLRTLVERQAAETIRQNTTIANSAAGSVNQARGIAGRSLGVGGASPASKPFSYVDASPAVSPYQNLYRAELGDAAPNYYSIVRPQLQQNSFQRQQQLRNQQLRRQMQELQSRPAFTPTGSRQMFPTGHSTIFRYYSHFYPGMQRRR